MTPVDSLGFVPGVKAEAMGYGEGEGEDEDEEGEGVDIGLRRGAPELGRG